MSTSSSDVVLKRNGAVAPFVKVMSMNVLKVTRHAVLSAIAVSLLSSCAAFDLVGRQSDRAAGLQTAADADAIGATGFVQSEFTVAQRLARLLQGPARAPDRRYPHGPGQHHR